jgi:hypothetical protein
MQRITLTEPKILRHVPYDSEERIIMFVVWHMLMRYDQPIGIKRTWDVLCRHYPMDIAEARRRLDGADQEAAKESNVQCGE